MFAGFSGAYRDKRLCCGNQGLAAEQRDNRDWRYVLLGEAGFYDWQSKGGRLADLLDFARVRPIGSVAAQQALI